MLYNWREDRQAKGRHRVREGEKIDKKAEWTEEEREEREKGS